MDNNNHDELRKKITKWLIEEYPFAEINIITNPNAIFQIKLTNRKGPFVALPSYLTLLKDHPDRMIIGFYWKLSEDYRKSIIGLKPEAKIKLQKDLNIGFLLMHLNLIIDPNFEDMQYIKGEYQLILDGLNKHTLIESLIKINCGHGYILSQIDLLLGEGKNHGFNPYKKLD